MGQVGTVATGADGDFAPGDPAGSLIELVHSLSAKYRKNGTFLMNRMSLSAVRRLKSAAGDYLFQANLADRLRMTLPGSPIVECDDMPDIEIGSTPIAFGDFRRAYLIVDTRACRCCATLIRPSAVLRDQARRRRHRRFPTRCVC